MLIRRLWGGLLFFRFFDRVRLSVLARCTVFVNLLALTGLLYSRWRLVVAYWASRFCAVIGCTAVAAAARQVREGLLFPLSHARARRLDGTLRVLSGLEEVRLLCGV